MLASIAAAVALHQWPYASEGEASQAALKEAYECSEHRRECGGVIYEWLEPGGRKWYFYSAPETSNKPFGVALNSLAEDAPAHMRKVADYHVHICSIHNRDFAAFFSVGDVLTNKGFGLVGYMLDSCTGDIHRFDPAQDDVDDEEVDLKSGRVFYLTIGHVSGWLPL
jgi:hypothetical protein